ncbi:GNAT family N-acetyltransferase [Streptomyces sp. RY43-2]|uniref:GNAT family N-acetyltransferase n=1 Tax=Streptomyces macrolidinus TaxID=2952607 RepID=A0ABT0ZFJ9_9ACTN|nr:GNAT family N-acetyltransferase [Streptomyces macrolidinus]MCN9242354.1 GNAT family N-acetyltransferase [Streptomyces macrolidinus]
MPSQREIVLPPSIRLSGDGLLLREWTEADLSALVEVYDDPEIDRWTPVPSPFDSTAAGEYLAKAREGRAEGRTKAQLAITTDGEQPRGEVYLFRCRVDVRDIELAYAVGSRHRRQGLASRAVKLATDYAHRHLGARRVLLRIEARNAPSMAVARATGFRLTDDEPVTREAKGRQVTLYTWCHHNGGADPVSP